MINPIEDRQQQEEVNDAFTKLTIAAEGIEGLIEMSRKYIGDNMESPCDFYAEAALNQITSLANQLRSDIVDLNIELTPDAV